jgi:hypothetical protein
MGGRGREIQLSPTYHNADCVCDYVNGRWVFVSILIFVYSVNFLKDSIVVNHMVMLSTDVCMYVTKCIVTKLQKLQTSTLV